ncbi:DMT family transporter [Sulfurimonas sp.]|uniref:DMT family transporter n=1 Tax=Sulfurimonas sp. TaxID=2022749 RepID=UPI002AB087E4|nr:SMR family transporter [Sulfurimonas sp.]
MSLAWIYLIIAGILEWGWPVGLKLGVTDAGFSIFISGALLLIAQRSIPMGTAYSIWTGIGAVGTFVLGILLFGETASIPRIFFISLIVVGIVGLKIVSTKKT